MVLLKKILFCTFFLLIGSSVLFAEKKVALVIGNAAYKNNPLKNPVQDAQALKNELDSMGFDVNFFKDVESAEKMDKIIKDFSKESKTADIALIYYSGHGIEYNGENFLIPTQNDIDDEDDLERKTVKVDRMLNKIGASGCSKLIVILDSCRNNPIKRSRGESRGLVPVSVDQGAETYIVYACAAGKTADDGNGAHSPFTQALINHISESKGFREIMDEVTRDVKNSTNSRQNPWKTDSLTENVYLNGFGNNSNNNDPVYIKEKGNLYALIIILFIVIVVLVTAGFLIFTARGKEALTVMKSGVGSGVERTKEFTKNTISQVSTIIKEKKEELAKKSAEQEKAEQKQPEQKMPEPPAPEAATKQEEPILAAAPKQPVKSILDGVRVKNLYVAKMPVTKSQFDLVMSGTGTDATASSATNKLPKINVSWLDAIKFLNKISEQENLEPVYDLTDENNVKIDASKNGWRLPFENEWITYAGKADLVSIKENASGVYECASSRANDFGIFDAYGLVWEWCNDSVSQKYKMLKGGSWDSGSKYYTKSAFITAVPNFASDSTGFRGVRNI